MIARNGESPYPGMEYDEQLSRITIVAGDMPNAHKSTVHPIEVRPYLAKFAGVEANITIAQPSKPSEAEVSGNIDSTCMADTQQMSDTEYTMLLHEIRDKIKLYMTCVDTGGLLGWAAYINFLNMVMLPPHEMIDLVYQFRKLYDGDSDQLATAAADEKIAQSGIKPGITRLKIERISANKEKE